MPSRLFLLSPASCTGNRARLLHSETAQFPLARGIRRPAGAPLGEVFSFISQLYFAGKLSYARAFACLPRGTRRSGLGDGVFVITTSRGLVPWRLRVTLETLREFASVELAPANEAYAAPLAAGARDIAGRLEAGDEVVLLGSIATDKYVGVLCDVLGTALRFPREFVGRGDMSRGGLLLRAVRDARELEYIPVVGAVRHGVRPPRLERIRTEVRVVPPVVLPGRPAPRPR